MKKRKKLHRVAALMAALVLAVSCMVPAPYYASDSCDYAIDLHNQFRNSIMDYGIEYKDNLPGVSSDYKFCTRFIFHSNANVVTCLLSNSPIIVKSEYDKDWKEYYLKGYFDLDNSVLYISTDACNTWTLLEENSGGVSYSAGYYYLGAYSFKSNGELNISSPSAVILDSSHPVYCEHGTVIFGEKEEVYNSSLGYVQDVSVKYLTIVGDLTGTQSRYKFSFSSSSTSGVDLSSGDYVIRLYEQATVYQLSALSNNMLNIDTPKILIGEYDAGVGSFDFNIAEALKVTDAGTGDIPGFNAFISSLLGYVRSDSYWLQIYNKTTGEYGGFVKLERSPSLDKSDFSSSTFLGSPDDVSGNGEKDNLGYVDNKVNGSTGSGTNFDDAELNADNTASSGSDSVLDQFYDMLSLISSVPKLFAALFGFLPDWCLNILGISVALSASIIIWKAAS